MSSDVAAAVLASKKGESRPEAGELAEVVMEVHSTLRRLTAEARRDNSARAASPDAAAAAGGVGSGGQ
ncbi:MAG TPA: hypothetical protein VIP46_02120 [Pyrinomonadaceae bacterium]